jgi:uncharacterized protein YmfQ (DUF2313 family)
VGQALAPEPRTCSAVVLTLAILRRDFLEELHHMAVKFAATLNAVNRGLDEMKPAKGADLIEDWETALSEVDIPGAKGISRDLAALRKQLEKPEPDSERVTSLIHRLGLATAKISERADKQGDKLKELGDALTEAGDEDSDEAEDTAAKAAPKRRGGRPAKAKK